MLHPDWPSGPEWRQCEMSIIRDALGGAHVAFKIRRISGGAEIQDLFESRGFTACLDRVLEDTLREGIPEHMPEDRQTYLLRASSRGAGSPQSGSPSMGFNVSYELRDILEALSNHERIALQAAAKRVAARQEKQRARFGPRP